MSETSNPPSSVSQSMPTRKAQTKSKTSNETVSNLNNLGIQPDILTTPKSDLTENIGEMTNQALSPSEGNKAENLDKIYTEASQWVRMANTVVWSTGSILVPAALAPFAFLEKITSIGHRCAIAFISIFLAFIWRIITNVYIRSNNQARSILSEIEKTWGIPNNLRYYTKQRTIINKGQGIIEIQNWFLVSLSVIWILVIVILEIFPNIK